MSLPRSTDPFEEPQVIEVSQLRDDFTEFLRQQNRQFVTPDGKIVTELDALVAYRDLLDAEQQEQTPHVLIGPPSLRKGVLGGAAKMQAGAPAQRVVNWAADRFDETTAMTVTLGVIDTDFVGRFNAGGAQNRPYANVMWLAGRGVPMSMQVDISKGCQFTICGSFIAVDVGVDAGNVAGSMNLGAWISHLPTQRFGSVNRTIFIDALGAGLTTTFRIPSMATGLLPLMMDQTTLAVGITLTFRDINGTTIYVIKHAAPAAQVYPTPISDDCYDCQVLNGEAGNVTLRAIFSLGV